MSFAEGDTLSSPQPRPASRVALIVGADGWCADALHSVLEPAGYGVLRARVDTQTLEIVVGAAPDVILVAVGSAHDDVAELCRRLRQEASSAGGGTAVIMVAVAPTSLAQRLAGLRAGAWDVLTLPMYTEELLARLDACVSVKLETDRIRTEGLLDTASSLYAARGVEYRARELLADASRHRLPLACVVLGANRQIGEETADPADAVAATRVVQHVAKVLRTHGRLSDIIGRWTDTQFAVLAPGTDAAGAVRLAQRLGQAVETSPPPPGAALPRLHLRAGYEAVSDAGATHLRAQDLLARAQAAFQAAQGEISFPRIRRYTPDRPSAAAP